MCNCFLGNAENFIFDPKCKPSDTPDCDWHVNIAWISTHKNALLVFFFYHSALLLSTMLYLVSISWKCDMYRHIYVIYVL